MQHIVGSNEIEHCVLAITLGMRETCSNQKQPKKCSIKKGALRHFVKFSGKHLRQSLFLNKVAGLRV